jgi:hypothetical protein
MRASVKLRESGEPLPKIVWEGEEQKIVIMFSLSSTTFVPYLGQFPIRYMLLNDVIRFVDEKCVDIEFNIDTVYWVNINHIGISGTEEYEIKYYT